MFVQQKKNRFQNEDEMKDVLGMKSVRSVRQMPYTASCLHCSKFKLYQTCSHKNSVFPQHFSLLVQACKGRERDLDGKNREANHSLSPVYAATKQEKWFQNMTEFLQLYILIPEFRLIHDLNSVSFRESRKGPTEVFIWRKHTYKTCNLPASQTGLPEHT